LPVFERALEICAAADIELRSPLLEEVSARAAQQKKVLIVSYHDFEKTPPLAELRQVITRAADYGAVVKIATLTKTENDLTVLRELLREKGPVALCVLGMGPLAAKSRQELPRLGSCFVYGYLDEPVAPGQPAARDLAVLLR
jgi:3-dehydroquinate dehydratase I